MTALSLALLATPLLFGLTRLVTTASDWRYLAVAIASTLGATAGLRWSKPTGSVRRLVVAFVCAVALAAVTALAVGAKSKTSIAVVAIGFAVCSAAGATLFMRARGGTLHVG